MNFIRSKSSLLAIITLAGLGAIGGRAIAEDAVDPGEDCAQAADPEALEAAAALAADDDAPVAPPSPAPSAEPPARGSSLTDSLTEILPTPAPTSWLPRGRRCMRQRGRMICDGPRRAPAPHGEPAALAERLGIGTRTMASRLLVGPADEAWLEAVPGEPSETLLWPVPAGRFWRGFGQVGGRRGRRLHKGIDIGAREGTPIRSVHDGLVIYADNGVSGYGNLMMILHRDGSIAFYAHCSALYLFPGQTVRRGQLIGEVGHSGLANGDHLHFELRAGGHPRDPLRRMVARPDETGGAESPPQEPDDDDAS